MKIFILPYGCGDVTRKFSQLVGCPELQARCARAAKLFLVLGEGQDEKFVLCASGQTREALRVHAYSVSEVMQRILLEQGVNPMYIYITAGQIGTDTFKESMVMNRMLLNQGFNPEEDELWAVSSDWHLPRIRMIWFMLYGWRVKVRGSGSAPYHRFSKCKEPLRLLKDFLRCIFWRMEPRPILKAQL